MKRSPRTAKPSRARRPSSGPPGSSAATRTPSSKAAPDSSTTSADTADTLGRFGISEERILQITNDIAEDMLGRPPVKELIACIKYWSLQHSLEVAKRKNLGMECISATLTALEKITKSYNER